MVAAGKGSLKGGPFWVLRPHSPEHRQHLTIFFLYYILQLSSCTPYSVVLCGDIVWLRAYLIFDIV